jgi:hypothetical protein
MAKIMPHGGAGSPLVGHVEGAQVVRRLCRSVCGWMNGFVGSGCVGTLPMTMSVT